jgi:hypothetical protein
MCGAFAAPPYFRLEEKLPQSATAGWVPAAFMLWIGDAGDSGHFEERHDSFCPFHNRHLLSDLR